MGTLQTALSSALAAPPPGLEQLRIAASHLAPLAPIINALRMSDDGRLLIAGGRRSDYPPELQEAPRIVIWDSQASNAGVRRMPPDVAAVVFSQFLSHPETSALLRDAARIGARFHRQTLTLQTIAELADECGLIPEPMPEPDRPTDTKKAPTMNASANPNPNPRSPYVNDKGQTARGGIAAFIRDHANIGAPVPRAEIDRLLALAKDEYGIPTTFHSLEIGYYLARKAAGLGASRTPAQARRPSRRAAEPLEPPSKAPAQAAQAAPEPASAPSAPPSANVQLEALLGLVDATAAGLSDALAGLDLIRNSLIEIGPTLGTAQAAISEVAVLRDKLLRIAAIGAAPAAE